MKKFFKSILSLFLLFFSVTPMNITATETDYSKYIQEVYETSDGIEIILSLSEEEVQELSRDELDEIHRVATENFISENLQLTSGIELYSRPTYYNEYGEAQRKVFAGYAGNQPSGGNRFSTGGGFYYSDNGGPSVSIGVGLAGLGGLFEYISVSVTLGNSTTSGKFVTVPNTVDYFKLYIEKTYDCKPYITYYTNSSGETSIYFKGVSKILYSINQYAKKVS